MEEDAYACAAVVMPASAAEADHERARLSWVANANSKGRERHIEGDGLPVSAETAFAKSRYTFARARSALAGDYGGLCARDGISVGMERSAAKGYGNAIVPQIQAEMIMAFMEIEA